ncbi:MAG: transposase [Spirochaetes bacterium]|nr:transposase [Spirochaetota bacterium]
MTFTVGAEYYRELDILTSMKGISVITAIAIMADVATIDRFPNQKKLCSYLRSAPGVDSSNDTIRMKGTNKFSRKLSISLLSQSLNHFRDSNAKLNRWYLKKTETQGHKVGKIRMGVCRKVFVEIYQMLKKGEYHYWTDEKNHRSKMDAYDRFLLKEGIEKILA